VHHRLTPYLEQTCEAGMACMLTMVQGNLLALTLSHWLIASQTGLLAGAIASTTVIAARLRRPWLVSLTLGLVTIPVDAFVHPGKFAMGGIGEAVVTGAAAFVLSLVATALVRALARRRAAAAARSA
jgi:hypothetical protein